MATQHDGNPTPDSRDESGNAADGSPTVNVRLKLSEFTTPVIRDGVVVGTKAPIDGATLKRAMGLLMHAPFEQLHFEDDVLSDIVVRSAILKRIPRDRLIRMVMRSVKPIMGASEIMQLEIDVTTIVETDV